MGAGFLEVQGIVHKSSYGEDAAKNDCTTMLG